MTLEDCLNIVDDEAPVEIRHDGLLAPIKGTSVDLWTVLDGDWINKKVAGITAEGGSIVLWLDSREEDENND